MCLYFGYYSNSLTVVAINLTEMVKLNLLNFLIFYPISNAVFRNMITLWDIDGSLKRILIFYLKKGFEKGQNSEISYFWKTFTIDFFQWIHWTETDFLLSLMVSKFNVTEVGHYKPNSKIWTFFFFIKFYSEFCRIIFIGGP